MRESVFFGSYGDSPCGCAVLSSDAVGVRLEYGSESVVPYGFEIRGGAWRWMFFLPLDSLRAEGFRRTPEW